MAGHDHMIRRAYVLALLAWAIVVGACLEHDRTTAPPIPSAISVALPRVDHARLPSGTDVWVVDVPDSGMVRLELMVRGGISSDPPGAPGLTQLLAQVLLEGTGGGDRQALLDRFGDLGADPSLEVTDATLGVRIAVAREDAEAAARLLGEVFARPTLAPEALARVRADAIDTLRFLADEPEALANLALAQAILGLRHATDIEGLGTIESLQIPTLEQVSAHLSELRDPARAALVVVGDLDLEAALRIATVAVAGWDTATAVAHAPAAPASMRAPPPDEIVLVAMPGLEHVVLAIGGELLPRDHPDEPSQSLVRDLAAGLVQLELRGRRQLSYGVVPFSHTRRGGGIYGMRAKVAPRDTKLALRAIFERFAETAASGLGEDAIAQARRGELVRTMSAHQAFDVSADALRRAWAYGFDPRVEEQRLQRLARLPDARIDAALRRELHRARLHIVVVGPPEVLPLLESAGLGTVRTTDRDELLGLRDVVLAAPPSGAGELSPAAGW